MKEIDKITKRLETPHSITSIHQDSLQYQSRFEQLGMVCLQCQPPTRNHKLPLPYRITIKVPFRSMMFPLAPVT